MNGEKLPIQLKQNQLAINKRETKRKIEGVKRIGKIVLSLGVGFSGLVVSAIGGPVTTIAGLGVAVATISNAEIDMLYKKISKNSMFVQRRQANGEIKISQSIKDFKSFQKMKGFNSYEKGAMMGLELLVELQAIKQQFEDRGIEKTKDGEKNLYPQVFCTTTHGVNIDTIEALETLGYLQIERKEPKRKSKLFIEKLGFGEYKSAIESLKSNKEVQMYEIALKVTDKSIDFDEIYREYTQLKGNREKTEKNSAIKRVGIILEGLRKQNIDIVKNDIGEIVIDYNAEESFAKRIKREQANTSAEFRKANYIGDKIEQNIVCSQETISKTINKENETER